MKIVVEDVFGKNQFNACKEYNRRLDVMEINISKIHNSSSKSRFKEGTYERWYREANTIYMNNKRDQDLFDKLGKDLCVVIPSHRYQRVWLKACLEGVSKLGYFSILAYDNPFFQPAHKLDAMLPSPATLMLADYLSFKPRTYHSGVGFPHLWNMLFAVTQAQAFGFKYIFCINGDFIMERPENFEQLRDMLGDGDIFPLAWDPKRPTCGTAAFIAKTDHQVEFWRNYAKTFYQNMGNAEARLGKYYTKKKLKVVHFEPGSLSHQMPNPKSTWYNTIGLRHLHAEHKIRKWNRQEPIEEKYFEKQFFPPPGKNIIEQYWRTGDKKFLKQWWGKGK
ncbi:MAG: hypothetical protein GOV02_03105 [Candidatus Aenigmarchaeota archaeon]|nr:hypothetical protein [Candidatus Aenigmarchaeota archaeon]